MRGSEGERERGRASASAAAAAAMWPPDPEPDPDPEPAGSSQPSAALPGLRALLPARDFLCSLKGRLLLAETVSAAPTAPSRRSPAPGGRPRLQPRRVRLSWANFSRLGWAR